MRRWRRSHPLTEEQRRKDIARSYAGVYLRRGKIQREPCKRCGAEKAEMHHHDYDKPLEVEWLCRRCHLAEHHPREDRA
jgi:ribosomal protein S27AE